jgi:hypothetical protein
LRRGLSDATGELGQRGFQGVGGCTTYVAMWGMTWEQVSVACNMVACPNRCWTILVLTF